MKMSKAGIGQMSDAVTVLIGNYCHHNKTAGIGFASCEAGTSTVMNNRIIDNALVAVGINAGWNVRLSGNELSRKGGLPPVVMVSHGAEAILTGKRYSRRGSCRYSYCRQSASRQQRVCGHIIAQSWAAQFRNLGGARFECDDDR